MFDSPLAMEGKVNKRNGNSRVSRTESGFGTFPMRGLIMILIVFGI
jgi:hypothetical protein